MLLTDKIHEWHPKIKKRVMAIPCCILQTKLYVTKIELNFCSKCHKMYSNFLASPIDKFNVYVYVCMSMCKINTLHALFLLNTILIYYSSQHLTLFQSMTTIYISDALKALISNLSLAWWMSLILMVPSFFSLYCFIISNNVISIGKNLLLVIA